MKLLLGLLGASAVAARCSCDGCDSKRLFGDGAKLAWVRRCKPSEVAFAHRVNAKVGVTKVSVELKNGVGETVELFDQRRCIENKDVVFSSDNEISVEMTCHTCTSPGCNCDIDYKFLFGCMEVAESTTESQ
ncbi:MAG: hypothetical protein MHM6MM_002024 [Cercozoa sp. M6MM]